VPARSSSSRIMARRRPRPAGPPREPPHRRGRVAR
jgi:hypothetical protein